MSRGKYLSLEEARKLGILLIMALIVAGMAILACLAGKGEAATIVEVQQESVESCLDPKNLPSGLKEAYQGLKSKGYDIKVTCKAKQPGLTKEQKEEIRKLNEN